MHFRRENKIGFIIPMKLMGSELFWQPKLSCVNYLISQVVTTVALGAKLSREKICETIGGFRRKIQMDA
jgi:hypothetical protein